MAESVFARQPKPRMRQQRNNSVAQALDGPAGRPDEAQLSIVSDADEPTFDDVVDVAGPDAGPEQDAAPQDDPEQDAAPQGDPAPDVEPTGNRDEPAEPASSDGAAEAAAPQDAPAPEDAAKANSDEDIAADATDSSETAGPTPGGAQGPDADEGPAQQAPEPAPAPASTKKTGRAATTKARTSNRTAAPTSQAGSGAALAVINPDGSVTVDAGTHLIDLRDVAAQDDPHALVDMLGALRTVTDSDLRQHVTAEISAAITAAALRT